MKSVCFYSSYVVGADIPYYVQFYLQRLTPHFSKIVYITNERELSEHARLFLQQSGIESMTVSNEGYDFGMWFKALAKYDTEEYQRIALINDSCILYKTLDEDFFRINASGADYCGMIISDRYATHLQSFFLVINERAIPVLKKYFLSHGIVRDYRSVIQIYEIGLTQEMISKGMKVFSLYNNENRSFAKNPSFALVRELIEAGMPMIKKKIVYRNYRGLEYYWVVRMNFDTDYRRYIRQVKARYKTGLIDFDKVMAEAPRKSNIDIWLFAIARTLVNLLKRIPGMRWVFHRLLNVFKKYFRSK